MSSEDVVAALNSLEHAVNRLVSELRERRSEPVSAELQSMPAAQVFKCSSCVGKYLTAQEDRKNGVLHNGEPVELPVINDGVVWLPSWQSQMVGPQMVVTAVPLPSCLECCNLQEESEVERATKSGLVLGGPHSMPN